MSSTLVSPKMSAALQPIEVDSGGYERFRVSREDKCTETDVLVDLLKADEKLRHAEKHHERKKMMTEFFCNENGQQSEDQTLEIQRLRVELQHYKEALIALKADRKRLKAEKYDCLTQMKQLFNSLDDKEKELREFIRNYELRMRENDETLRQLATERDEAEREKWRLLRHVRDEADRSLSLSTQLGLKENQLQQLKDEMKEIKKKFSEHGYYSDQESGTSASKSNEQNYDLNGIINGAVISSDKDSGIRGGSDRESSGLAGNLSDSAASQEDFVIKDTLAMTPPNLSVSAEYLNTSKEKSLSEFKKKMNRRSGNTWGSISRIFMKTKNRKTLDLNISYGSFEGRLVFGRHIPVSDHAKRTSWSPYSSACSSPMLEDNYIEKLKHLEETFRTPMGRWQAGTVLAWIEIALGMHQYKERFGENIRSGKILLELSDDEFESYLGIRNAMHRKKLRLAIEENKNFSSVKYPKISHLDHIWVCNEWLTDIGLCQYREAFSTHLIDGRMLEHLTKKELDKYLGVSRKFHQASVFHAIQLLRMIGYDVHLLRDRQSRSENHNIDPLFWTNQRFIKWIKTIDLAEYADNLLNTGINGALVILEASFTAETMASALGIPHSKVMLYRHLASELEALVGPARHAIEEQSRQLKLKQEGLLAKMTPPKSNVSLNESSKEDNQRSQRSCYKSNLSSSLSKALGLKLKKEIVRGHLKANKNSDLKPDQFANEERCSKLSLENVSPMIVAQI